MGKKSSDQLTPKQLEILQFIKEYTLRRNFPPSVREICQAVDLRSTSSVHAHLDTLEAKGYIMRDNQKSRTIEILDDDFAPTRRELTNVPMVGKVAAGEPLLAVQNITDYFPIPVEYLPNAETFMLKVKGDSMINVGIFDGDSLLVEVCSDARNGEIVVALVEDGATVKRFFKEDGHIRLQPENDSMDPIIVKDVTILGRVIGLFRLMR